jgi:uncharacterized protein YndB with AHSA1/START domain
VKRSPRRLVVRRLIEASAEALFDAWTTPAQLLLWWGPRGSRCTHATVDLRVGGRYRLGSALPDGRTVFIVGEFVSIDRPRELAYTWGLEPGNGAPECVTIRFRPRETGTEVVVVHERIRGERARRSHAEGWQGCLDGLAALIPTACRGAGHPSPKARSRLE